MSQNKPFDEAEVAQKVRESLDAHELPEDVQRKLRQARAQAVEQVDHQRDRSLNPATWLLPAGVLGAVGVAWVLSDNVVAPSMPVFEEQELAAANDMELLEDIEFIAWMMEQAQETTPDDS